MALSHDLCPMLKPGVKLESLPLTPSEGFVVSRVNGLAPIREIIVGTGMPAAAVEAALLKLEQLGAIEWQKVQSAAPRTRVGSTIPQASQKANTAVDFSVTLERLDLMFRSLPHQDLYQVLGVPRTASDDDVKSAYASLSREFHPDRFFNVKLGARKDTLDTVFAKISEAYETLHDRQKRAAYDRSILPPELRMDPPKPAEKGKYLATDPSRISALAETELRSGNYLNAIKNFKIAAAMAPGDRALAMRLAFVENLHSLMTNIDKLNKDPAGARALEDKVLVPMIAKIKKERDQFQVDEKTIPPLVTFLLNFDADTKLAKEFADKLFRRSPRPANAYLLGRVFEKEDNVNEALKLYQKAVDGDADHTAAKHAIKELKKRKR